MHILMLAQQAPYWLSHLPNPRFHFHVICTYTISCIYIHPRSHKREKAWLSFWDGLNSLHTIVSSFTHFPVSNITSSLWLRKFHCVYTIFFTLFPVVGHLSWFHHLTAVNRAAINIAVCKCLCGRLVWSPSRHPKNGITGSYYTPSPFWSPFWFTFSLAIYVRKAEHVLVFSVAGTTSPYLWLTFESTATLTRGGRTTSV